jgi:anti-sigma regulatory factor (Ser/Thr protein kinase)
MGAIGNGGGFAHAALIVDSDRTIERTLVPLLLDHLAAREPVLMVVGAHTERAVRSFMGQRADALEWATTDTFYQRLGFTYEGFRRYLADQHARGRRVHLIAEPDMVTDLTAPIDRVAAYLVYESMCNEALAAYGCPVTCLWDSRRHPTLVIEGVRSIHDHELTEDGPQASASFIPPASYLAGRADVTMPALPSIVDVELVISATDELASARLAVEAWASGHGFSEVARKQVMAAANEVLTNGLQHGRPPVRLRCWHYGRTLIVHVEDHGAQPIPADAGYRAPGHPSQGMGLWTARQFADVLISHTDDRRTSVRMYFPFVVTHRQMEPRPV